MKKKYLISLIFALLLSVSVKAENDKWQAGARSSAMGDASLLNQDVWAGFNNPGALTGLDSYSVGIAWENRFLVEQLSYAAFSFAMPLNSDVISINYSRFGYSLYNENRLGLAYSKKLTDWLSMGIQFNYLSTVQPEYYGNSNILTFDIGLLANMESGLMFGAHVFNPVNIDFNGSVNRELPVAMRVGVGYWFSDDFLGSLEMESDMSDYNLLKAGFEYRLLDHFFISAGINVKPVKGSFGIAYEWNSLRIDLAYSYHQELGNSPHLGVSYAF